jgi:hypothetical protein
VRLTKSFSIETVQKYRLDRDVVGRGWGVCVRLTKSFSIETVQKNRLNKDGWAGGGGGVG